MKAIFSLLILGAAVAQASVDYIAIGALVNEGKKDIARSKAGVACLMRDYAQNPTCEKIEKINQQTKLLLNSSTFDWFVPKCEGIHEVSSGVGYLRYKYLQSAKALAVEAETNDPIFGVIQSLEAAINQLITETNDILIKAKLQQTYVNQCLLGQEPPSKSILDQLCQ